MNIQMISLNKLIVSPANVRKTGTKIGIEELAASIQAHGLLQNLQVRPGAKGKFEVVAGGRRLAALKLLAKEKSLAKDAEIACHVLEGEDAGEISLAENTLRLPMHPADQFTAFHALTESGKGPEDIAARFGTSAAIVRQRLKLAAVSPALIDLYRDDEMSLDQLMAFTVSDDHEAQEAAWFDHPDWQRQPAAIKRALTEAHVDADDNRVLFVGLEVYQAAGGGIVRDLFEPEHEGYLTDPALLNRLVTERLETEAATIRAEGWKWVEIMPQRDFAGLRAFGRMHPEQIPLAPEQQNELDRITAEYETLIDTHGDDPEPEIAAQIDALADKIENLSEGNQAWRPGDIALAGAIVCIGHDGRVDIDRGLLRPEDRKAVAASHSDEDDEDLDSGSVDAEPDPSSPLSVRLIEDLTAERTAALRAMLQDNETVALAATAHALALPVFYKDAYRLESSLDLRLGSRDLHSTAEPSVESAATVLLATRLATWEKRLPEGADDLFGWLLAQETATVTGLIAFCAAMSVNAVRSKQDRPGCPRLAHADALAAALGLDMALWWEPTKERYLGRVSKALILDAVAEGVSPAAASNLEKLKKDDLIARAGERLAGKGWLPALLRSSAPADQQADDMPLAAE